MNAIEEYVITLRDFQKSQKKPDFVRFFQHFLDVATRFTTVDWKLSKTLAKEFFSEPQCCYENCQLIAWQRPDLQYFEGYVSAVDMPTEHSWLVNESGKVIDPTIVLMPKLVKRVAGYMGVKIPMDYLYQAFLKEMEWDSRIDEGFEEGVW